MKKVLIASYDMEVGGVERSLISMLEHFDYTSFKVDLMLYRHQGEFMNLIPPEVTILNEVAQYTTFRKSIKEVFKEKHYRLGLARLQSKVNADVLGKIKKMTEPGYYQMQLMWKYSLPFLPELEREYDVAISYLWPHYFVAEKVKAKKKIAWIHTDYSTVETDINLDLKLWNKFDHIIAVSDACKDSFLNKYGALKNKITVIENITSPHFIKKMSNQEVDNPMENDNRFKILTVARLSHAKGIDIAIKALKILKDEGFENIVWYLVGYGGDELKIKELIKTNELKDTFILLGKKTNPYPFIKKANIYVQPSRYEGKAVTVREAQVLGKPVLITNYPTSKSQGLDGVDLLITSLSPKGVAEGISSLIRDDNLRKKLSYNTLKTDYSNKKEIDKLNCLT
ncbi:glycosyl transferase [Salipaludibacillus neizhouensis]|uniref:Glycosyl transferase n=1 Tax=Salipaludibacillus neizhouensis TaxID=885475 RepID=A0A3A9KNY9_9BACI|nr:glycosyltransferase [Salipaludibacillus neizhouensis]RKL66426.1 glycosyl transferase [Salipaludibacillus neizhouensis]